VRSYHGAFAYLTCPIAIHFFKEDLRRARMLEGKLHELAVPHTSLAGCGQPKIALTSKSALAGENGDVLLEEFDLKKDNDLTGLADGWADSISELFGASPAFSQDLFKPRFAIVHDDVFNYLCEAALPTVTRNAVGDDGIAKDTALWTEEFLPCETILSSLLHIEGCRGRDGGKDESMVKKFLADRAPATLQLGGKASVGRGFLAVAFASGPDATVFSPPLSPLHHERP
jgi:CRISPR-associated protein Cmr4